MHPLVGALASRRVLRLRFGIMNASEVLDGLAALRGARDSGADGNGIMASRLLNGIEYARAAAVEEAKLRSSWKRRQGGGATPLVLVADDPEQPGYVRVLGPQRDGPLRRIRSESLVGLVERTLSVKRLQAVRLLAEELDRLDSARRTERQPRRVGAAAAAAQAVRSRSSSRTQAAALAARDDIFLALLVRRQIDRRRLDRSVPEDRADVGDVRARAQQLRRAGVPQGVRMTQLRGDLRRGAQPLDHGG